MNCPNCGVYNPDERQVCWRCDKELPKPKEPKKRGPFLTPFRMWLLLGIGLLFWILLTWLGPLLFSGSAAPTPIP
jgi:hypothetical protein